MKELQKAIEVLGEKERQSLIKVLEEFMARLDAGDISEACKVLRARDEGGK